MKPQELLLEADALLLNFISNSANFQKKGSAAVFLYDDAVLSKLLRNGAQRGELRGLSTPAKNQQGLGVVDLQTGTVWVGAIDDGYEVYWASSLGSEPEYFRGKVIKDLSDRLQDLAEIFSSTDETEADGAYEPKGKGVERIWDFIENNPDSDYWKIRNDDFDAVDNTADLKKEFESKIKKLRTDLSIKKKQDQKLADIISMMPRNTEKEIQERRAMMAKRNELDIDEINLTLEQLEAFLKNEKHLFDEQDDEEQDTDKEDDKDPTDSVKDQLNAWTRDFQEAYPDLRIDNIYDFDPNQ